MAKFQLFAWKISDFESIHQAGSTALTLNSNSEPVTVKIDDCGDNSNIAAGPVLAEELLLENMTFSAGFHVDVDFVLETGSRSKTKLFFCRVGSQTDKDVSAKSTFVLSTNILNAGQTYTVTDASTVRDSAEHSISFARGTLIDTPHGPVAIEHFDTGDEVLTRDSGIQLITQVAYKRLSGLELLLNPSLRPICIQAGALPGGLPGSDLAVAQEHRVLLNDWRATYLFGEEEILVPAMSLLNGRNVTIECPETGIDYFHIALEQQNLITANGLWSETCVQFQDNVRVDISANAAQLNCKNSSIYADHSDTYRTILPTLPRASVASLAA